MGWLLEGSHSGLVHTLGKRAWGNPPRVRIPHPLLEKKEADTRCLPTVFSQWVRDSKDFALGPHEYMGAQNRGQAEY